MESETEQSEKKMKEKELLTWRKRLIALTSVVAVAASTAAILFSLTTFIKPPEKLEYLITPEVMTFQKRIEHHQNTIEGMQKRLDALVKIPSKTTSSQQVAALTAEIKAVSSRLEILEKGLLDTPEKALSVPLLRNDLQNLRQSYKQDIDTMAKAIDRVYDQNKWFIGLMFTMAVGLIGLAISNFLQLRKS